VVLETKDYPNLRLYRDGEATPVSDLMGRENHIFADGFSYPGHENVGQSSPRPPDEAPVVNGAKLIDEKIGVASYAARGRNPNAKRLVLLHQVRRQRNHERRGVVCVEKRLGLYDQDRPGLARLGASPRIQFRDPDFPAVSHRGRARWGKLGVHPHAFLSDPSGGLGQPFGADSRAGLAIHSLYRAPDVLGPGQLERPGTPSAGLEQVFRQFERDGSHGLLSRVCKSNKKIHI
jgi:hypothetical protein